MAHEVSDLNLKNVKTVPSVCESQRSVEKVWNEAKLNILKASGTLA